nr:hypothetical protein [uncultured Methanoregula sp.]
MMKFIAGKSGLAIVCILIILVSIIASIYFRLIFDSGILTVGVTAVLVAITAWYAVSTEKNVKIIERGSQGKYIAEISRSIFSPMLKDLKKARVNLERGSFLVGIRSEPTLEGINPLDFYLKGNIFICSKHAENAQMSMNRGVERPATSLLKNKDNILKKHYSDIETLTKKYSDSCSELKESIQQMSTHLPRIWDDFKTTCVSLDTFDLKDYFEGESTENSHESNYCLIFRTLILNKEFIGNPMNNYCISLDDIESQKENFLNSPRKDRRQFYDLAEFIVKNKVELNQWLSESNIKNDIILFQKMRMNLIKTIDGLSEKIEELLLDWKIEYYLTEDEMHLNEEYWGNSRSM